MGKRRQSKYHTDGKIKQKKHGKRKNDMQVTVSKKMLKMSADSGQLEEFIQGMEKFGDVTILREYQKELAEKKKRKKAEKK
ncbi:MAG: hypothetical protein CVU05_01975 [Bacteroidetes bacterium HGW-Bacteroidetes-21]|nr:MAG: hypothetical protein CVU05_01975 [Bacteroidetes bacterium HGW-Bacteroidetes-21]